MHDTLLGGLSPAKFLRQFWQKQPLLVRGAIPAFSGLLDDRQLFKLARRDDCESRLIMRNGREWHVEHGPLRDHAVRRLPARGWTLLVQGIDHMLPEARKLLARFDFVPHGRLDDLMVSYAPPGGGVGPHIDSYDVFLLQGPGRRRWRVGLQRDRALVAHAQLKILRSFQPQGDAILDPGDMLYLPPGYAHDGTAVTACFTYSIGFRAPRFDELKTQFLAYLDDVIRIDGIYDDPDLKPARHPGTIDNRMIDCVARRLNEIKWNRTMVRDFLGSYLTEPKGHVRFAAPAPARGPGSFSRAVKTRGVQLAPASQLLIHGTRAFINGEAFHLANKDRPLLARLADARGLARGVGPVTASVQALLYRWYRDGYVCLT